MKGFIDDELSNLELGTKAMYPHDDTNKRNLSHLEVVRACSRSSEHPAWAEFYCRFDRFIKMYVMKAWKVQTLGRSKSAPLKEETMSDLVQEVYLKLLSEDQKALRSFRGQCDGSFLAYLSRMAFNIVAEHFRKQRADKRNAQVVSVDQFSDRVGDRKIILRHLSCNPEKDFLSGIAFHELSELLDEILRGLNGKRDKLIFILYHVDGMTVQEIASIRGLGLKVSGVDSIIRRTRKRLQQVLIRIAA